MSLINDALKRASQSDRNRQRETRKPTPMQPATGGPPPKSSSMAPVLGVCVVLALGLAAWFFFQWWHVRHTDETVKIERASAPPPVVRQVAPPVAATPPPEPVVAVPPPPKTVPVVPAPEPAPAPPPAQAVPPPWPVELKLMGIFYNQTSPQALINARTVNVGDEIEGIRVTKIARDAVTVEWNGQTKQLTLE